MILTKNSVAVPKHLCLVLLTCYAGGPGLLDPCEKGTVDAGAELSNQQREDITAVAQVGTKYRDGRSTLLH